MIKLNLFDNVSQQQMPKLRKHSQIKQHQLENEQSQTGRQGTSKQAESNSLLDNPLAKRKMKYRDRAALISTFENRAKQSVDADEESFKNTPSGYEGKQTKDADIDNYISKFKDDDEFVESNFNPTVGKKKKKGIRSSNKMFADYNFQEAGQIQTQQLQLVVQRRETKNPELLLAKVERKVEGFKNRLQFKNLQQDHKFKKDMKEKLKSLQGCQEVDIVIAVPQVLATKKHVDGALFLKNVKDSSTPITATVSVEQECEEQIHKDRKQFYQNLTKKMKMKKAETITQSALKQCFKKSRLDADDYLFEDNSNKRPEQDGEKSQTLTYGEGQVQHSITNRDNYNKQVQKNIQPGKKQDEQMKKYVCQSAPCETPPSQQTTQKEAKKQEETSIQKHQESNKKNEESSYDQSQEPKEKTKKKKKRGKKNKFNIHDLIQEEAEDSEDENCPKALRKQEDQQISEDDDGDLSSLIDDEVTLCEEEEEHAHRKFIKDMIEMQEKKFQKMRKKLHQQRIIDQEKLRQRMEAAAKRNANREKSGQKAEIADQSNSHSQLLSDHSEESISNAKNVEKLKQLEIDLGIAKQPSQSTTSSHPLATSSSPLANFQRLMNLETVQLRKPTPGGLKNVEKYKTRPKTKPKISSSN